MTLIYDKNSKMDNRKVEYEQSIVRLGLEKAATQREADRARQEIKDLGARKIQVMKDIKNLEDDLVADRKKLQEVGLEVFEMIKNAEANVSKIREKEKEVVNSTGNKKFELKKLEEYLASLTEQIHERNLLNSQTSGFVNYGVGGRITKRIFKQIYFCNSEVLLSNG